MEVGRYIDFHTTSADGQDYTHRLNARSDALELSGNFACSNPLASLTAGVTVLLSTNTEVTIPWTVLSANQINCFSMANSFVTVQVGGVYQLCVSWAPTSVSSNVVLTTCVYVNSVARFRGERTLTCVLNLAANDTVYVTAMHNLAATSYNLSTDTTVTWCQLYKLG